VQSPDYQVKKFCVLCNKSNLSKILDLGKTPLANELLHARGKKFKQEMFDLIVGKCDDCMHIQLLSMVNPSRFFTNYPYFSKINSTTNERFQNLSLDLDRRYRTIGENFLLEIGSNDGSLCSKFLPLGWKVLGVDPAESPVGIALANGIDSICDYFSSSVAENILKDQGYPNLIIANNVLAHSDYLRDIFLGIRLLMHHQTVLVLEVSYGLKVFENFLFDTIYHEHTSYHTVFSMLPFLESYGLKIFDIEQFDAHGGSIRLHICLNDSSRSVQKNVEDLLNQEIASGINETKSWISYSQDIDDLGVALRNKISNIRKTNQSIAGYGVPAKFSTLFHVFKLDQNDFEIIVDDNPIKQGHLAPGTNLEIFDPKRLQAQPVDHILLFSWNYEIEISHNIKTNKLANKSIIVPLPKLRIHEIN
jgi:hypothetical protein